MRNRWGIEIKRGHWVLAHAARGGKVEGRVMKIDRTSELARAYGPRLELDSGVSISADDVVQTLGPMEIGPGGVVTQNPLSRVKINSPSQRAHVGKTGRATKKPDARLIKRRTKTAKTKTRGVWANPLVKGESNANAARYAELYGGAASTIRAWSDHYIVRMHKPDERTWTHVSVFKNKSDAMAYARAYARQHPALTVSVIDKSK